METAKKTQKKQVPPTDGSEHNQLKITADYLKGKSKTLFKGVMASISTTYGHS